ncbi:MAG: hypothetical protein PVF05_12880, partial [Gemmatimonadales bacterium]
MLFPGRTLLMSVGGLAAAAALAASPPGSPTAPALWAGLVPGQFHVGYEQLRGNRGPVFAWYPAPAAGPALRFGDYLDDGEAAGLARFLGSTGIPGSTIDSLFASPLFAATDGPALDAPFPIVVVAQGNGESVIDQVVLCEYLASRGYVVVTTPSPTRETPLEREDQVGEFAERQADDLAAAVEVVAASLPADTSTIGVVGHSFGARAAL